MLIGKGEVEMDPEKSSGLGKSVFGVPFSFFKRGKKPMVSQSWPDALAMTPKAGVGMP